MILVTGASGNVGAALIARLRERGATFRIGARTASHSGAQERVRFDFLDPTTYAAALRGVGAVFLLRPPQIANTRRTLNPFIDVAQREGVRQIVFVSVVGADRNRWMPHHAVEGRLRAGPEGWTILQPGFFAQNFGDAYQRDIVRDDRIYLPAGDGRVAFIDVRDMAEVAADALLTPAPHAQRTYVLTGGEAITFDEAAGVLSQELQRPIHYRRASVLGYFAHLRREGLPLRQSLIQTALHTGLRYGQATAVDPTLNQLLGRPPRSLRDYVRDHRELWMKSAVSG